MPISFYFLLPILCAASWLDWRQRRIPNALLLPAFLIALMLNSITFGLNGLYFTLAGLSLGFLLLIVPYLLGGMGAGDVKLLMVIGSFGGFYFVLSSFILGALIGGAFSIAVYLYNTFLHQEISTLPYGIPLSLGTIVFIILGNGRF